MRQFMNGNEQYCKYPNFEDPSEISSHFPINSKSHLWITFKQETSTAGVPAGQIILRIWPCEKSPSKGQSSIAANTLRTSYHELSDAFTKKGSDKQQNPGTFGWCSCRPRNHYKLADTINTKLKGHPNILTQDLCWSKP